MTEGDQPVESPPESGAKSIAIMVVGFAIILAGMTWFVTYDWPSGERPSIGVFVMFWFRELLALGIVFVALCALVVQKIFGGAKEGSKK